MFTFLCWDSFFIQEIIKADMEEAGSEDVFRKIKKDFQLGDLIGNILGVLVAYSVVKIYLLFKP